MKLQAFLSLCWFAGAVSANLRGSLAEPERRLQPESSIKLSLMIGEDPTTIGQESTTNLSVMIDSNTAVPFSNTSDNGEEGLASNNSTTFFAQYRASFHTILDNTSCSVIPSAAHALCNGTITLINVSSSSIVCLPMEDVEDHSMAGYSSGLTCTFYNNSNMYASTGMNSTSTWGSVDYQCEGTNVSHVDSLFVYEDIEPEETNLDSAVEISRQGLPSCEPQHFSQLSVACREPEYHADLAYFECDRTSHANNLDSLPTKDLICINDGAFCDDKEEECGLHSTRILADHHNFGKGCIGTTSDIGTIPPMPKPQSSPREQGIYVATYRVNHAYLLKDEELWTDAEGTNCTGDLPSVKLVCNQGTISMPASDSSFSSLQCDTTGTNTVTCGVDASAQLSLSKLVNQLGSLVYTCNATNTFPTTRVDYESGSLTCSHFDNLAVTAAHGLQLGILCSDEDQSDSEDEQRNVTSLPFRYDEYFYECGTGNEFHMLDNQTNGGGDVFTCIRSTSISNETFGSSRRIGPLTIQSDWRLANLDDSRCYQFTPKPTPSPTPAPVTTSSSSSSSTSTGSNTGSSTGTSSGGSSSTTNPASSISTGGNSGSSTGTSSGGSSGTTNPAATTSSTSSGGNSGSSTGTSSGGSSSTTNPATTTAAEVDDDDDDDDDGMTTSAPITNEGDDDGQGGFTATGTPTESGGDDSMAPTPGSQDTSSPTIATTNGDSSRSPSQVPSSHAPSLDPSSPPSVMPSPTPSNAPSGMPTPIPSNVPSSNPSVVPSSKPLPSNATYVMPSPIPSNVPSSNPSMVPSSKPLSSNATYVMPSPVPSNIPSSIPSLVPSSKPSLVPSLVPSNVPSRTPTDVPSDLPTQSPTALTEDAVDTMQMDEAFFP